MRAPGAFTTFLLVAAFAAAPARAQSPPTPTSVAEEALSLLAPKPHSSVNPLTRRSRDYRGLALGDWILYPTINLGAIYDSNLVWSTRHPVQAAGLRLNPALVAQRDSGPHRTTLYADVDARLYPTLAYGDAVNAQLGAAHVWEIARDLSVSARAEYTRKAQHISGGVAALPGGGFSTLASPLVYDQLSGALAVHKSFGRMFAGLSLEAAKTYYDSLRTTSGTFSQSYRDSFAVSLGARGGFWFTPALYAFAETIGNVREIEASTYDSKGYRVVAGLGSDRISLFRGEIFAGVHRQNYDNPLIAAAASPILGGKIFWYPTRAITVRAALDQTFSDSSMPTPGNPAGFPARQTSAQAHVTYQMSKSWQAAWRIAFEHSAYLGTIRRDNGWRTGATLAYDLYRNVALTLDYEFQRLHSIAPDASYVRNAVNLGMKYRY